MKAFLAAVGLAFLLSWNLGCPDEPVTKDDAGDVGVLLDVIGDPVEMGVDSLLNPDLDGGLEKDSQMSDVDSSTDLMRDIVDALVQEDFAVDLADMVAYQDNDVDSVPYPDLGEDTEPYPDLGEDTEPYPDLGVDSPASNWRVVEVPGFENVHRITDSKIYRLQKPNEFVFVFSHGSYLSTQEPRTSYIGHVDASDSIELTNMWTITEQHAATTQKDIADLHVHVSSYDPDDLWLSWACGSDTYVCAMRYNASSKSFDGQTFFEKKATGLFRTTHEPSITCDSGSDCLLTWGETMVFTHFDLYAARWTNSGWCADQYKVGINQQGLPLEMSYSLGNNSYRLGAIAPNGGATGAAFHILDLDFANAGECQGGVVSSEVVDSDFEVLQPPAGDFHYDGSCANVAPHKAIANVPIWYAYAYNDSLKVIRLDDQGQVDASEVFANSDPMISIKAGNVEFDGEKFYVFYHKFVGKQASPNGNTYSICYRTTMDATSTSWGQEECPLENLPGLEISGSEFFNMIQPVGSVWQGQIAIIFQKDCVADTCSLALLRND